MKAGAHAAIGTRPPLPPLLEEVNGSHDAPEVEPEPEPLELPLVEDVDPVEPLLDPLEPALELAEVLPLLELLALLEPATDPLALDEPSPPTIDV